jgi:hypothetical protein
MIRLGPSTLALALTVGFGTQAIAGGSRAPQSPTPPPANPSNPTPPPNNGADTLIDLGINVGIVYAKQDPRYNAILTTLGINSAADVRALLAGNANGFNFQGIIARLAFLESSRNAQLRDVFARLGITNESQLRAFLGSGDRGLDFERILSAALLQAQGNSRYATWLSRLGIRDIQSIKNLLSGQGSQGNVIGLALTIALSYVESKPRYAQYVPLIRAALMSFGVVPASQVGDPTRSDDDIIDLGPYSGMTNGEVRAARAIR